MKGTLTVRWETVGRGREIIPARYLYSQTLTARLRATYVRFLKTVSLTGALKLTASETVYFAAHADYSINSQGWLNSLPIVGNPDGVTSTALLNAFTALLDFARIKAEFSPDDERLLTVLKNPEALNQSLTAATAEPERLLLSLTRWDSDSLDALLNQLGKVKDGKADRSALRDLATFSRVTTANFVMKKLGIPAFALINATTNEPNATTVRDLQAALRARYVESDWLDVLKPINDEMRALQRDALVAYILHQMRANPDTAHIDTPDKLFEYFLMDVQMAPCMQTSRIRHALSSVQLFIERCLMNLEKNKVAASSIKAKQWEWMKRYRVWEANRKIFLWPENWLEPELRDDQSPFFKEAMSELLQSDITEDSAAVTLLNYLSKLDEVAKLEPCGIHYVENDLGTSDDIAHVVARTAGANRKYFYRRREFGYWTPWEHIKLDIEDNPVIPVIWKGRLFLFWLRILKQTPGDVAPDLSKDHDLAKIDPAKLVPAGAPKIIVQAILCWSEYYNSKWQPTKTSDVNSPASLGSFDLTFDRSRLSLSALENDDSLVIAIDGGHKAASFVLYNTHSLPVPTASALGKISGYGKRRSLSSAGNLLTAYYSQKDPDIPSSLTIRKILADPIDCSTVAPYHFLNSFWDAPFFFEDRRHVFFVTTTNTPVTISTWNGYLPIAIQPQLSLVIPSLVFAQVPLIPNLPDSAIIGPQQGVVDVGAIKQFVSEDAYIKKGICTTGSVLFGGVEIGAAGNRNPFQQR